MSQARSHSSVSAAGIRQKLTEARTFLGWRFARGDQFDELLNQLDSYKSLYERLSGEPFEDARILEIGFGARPLRLIAMMSMGRHVKGIDLDVPILDFSISRIVEILKTNGAERAAKTAVRNLLFDKSERASLRRALERRGFNLRIESSGFLVGDAATYDYGDRRFDLIYSEDVFEHIPPADLEQLIARLPSILTPAGVALIRPNVYTGITGGHLVEWYPHQVSKQMPRSSEPWEHLRKCRRAANTYLNRLPRSWYREMFAKHFDVVEENVYSPELGREWLTPAVRQELAAWSEDELFSNKVQFVLRQKQ